MVDIDKLDVYRDKYYAAADDRNKSEKREVIKMQRTRKEVENLEELVGSSKKKIFEICGGHPAVFHAEVLMHPALEEIVICPCCGNHVAEKQKGYFCEGRGCNFALWKQTCFFKVLGKKMQSRLQLSF